MPEKGGIEGLIPARIAGKDGASKFMKLPSILPILLPVLFGFTVVRGQTVVFNDTLAAGSTINSNPASPAPPLSDRTAYQQLSAKTFSPNPPTIAAGHLRFGIVNTSSGFNSIEALFSQIPVTLANIGDYLELTVTFTNQASLMNGANASLFFGLHDSGQVQPIPGGMNGTVATATAGHAQGWQGYVSRMIYSGGTHSIGTRPAQSAGAANNQDVLYNFSGGSNVSTSTTPTLNALTVGAQYTSVLRITKSAASSLTILSTLHEGADSSGAPLFTHTASSPSILTATFDALGIGYRAVSGASVMDVNAIKVITNAVMPSITQQPASAAVVPGSSHTLTAAFTGSAPLTATWQKSTDGGTTYTDIPGTTTASSPTSYTIHSVQPADAGKYRLLVTNSWGAVPSDAATLSLNYAPVPTSQPASRTVQQGSSVTFEVIATGPGTLSYQWSKNGTPISGQTQPFYTISSVVTADAGDYTVQVSNAHGSVTSQAAVLVVLTQLPIPAFPGAEGPGATATGGRGCDVFHVTTLADDRVTPPAGSLRQALTTVPAGGRTIVFDVGGTIQLSSSQANDAGSLIWLRSGANNVTIAGQTAPYPGITIIGQGTKLTGSNVVLRNIAFRPGPDKKSPGIATNDALSLQTKNSIIDHVSASFADDEGISPTDAAENTTVQYSIIAEGLNYVLQDGTAHAMGGLLASEVSDAPLSLHHNLFSDMRTRNPRIGNDGNGVTLGGPNEGSINHVSNNIIYNWDGRASYDVGGKPARANFLNNYFIAGPDTAANARVFYGTGSHTRIFHGGNFVDMDKDTSLDGVPFDFSGPQFEGAIAEVPTPFPIASGHLQSAASAYDSVLDHAGAFWWNRTPLDARVIHEVRTLGGFVIKTGTQVSNIPAYNYPATSGGPTYQEPAVPGGGELLAIFDGLPLFTLVSRPTGFDSDADGMPDTWELNHGLNPSVADPNGDFDTDGYTNLEEYLNELAAFPAPKVLRFVAGGGRYELPTNWDLNWQPSRHDSIQIHSGTTTVDSTGQHARNVTVSGSSIPAELRLNAGRLTVSGSVTVGGTDGPGKLTLAGGSLIVEGAAGVVIAQGGALSGSGTLTSSLQVQSGGTVDSTGGVLNITGNVTNSGTMRLTGGAALTVSGTFVNNGLLDIMTGTQTLPANFINNGIVLDSSAVRVATIGKTSTTFTVTIQGYAGHAYQLQSADTLSGPWTDIGPAQSGTNSQLTFQDSSSATAPRKFYRIRVNP